MTSSEAVIYWIGSSGVLSGVLIAVDQPDRLVHGLLAIIGDAPHAVSPMTGRGFLTGEEDAATITDLLPDHDLCRGWRNASEYEQTRLLLIEGLVDHSVRITNEYSRFDLTDTSR